MAKGKKRTVPAWIAPSVGGGSEVEPIFAVVTWWSARLDEEDQATATAARVVRVLTNCGGLLSHGGINNINAERSFSVTWAFGRDEGSARSAARKLSQMHGVKHVHVIRQPGDIVIWTKRS